LVQVKTAAWREANRERWRLFYLGCDRTVRRHPGAGTIDWRRSPSHQRLWCERNRTRRRVVCARAQWGD